MKFEEPRSKSKRASGTRRQIRWIVTVFLVTVVVSGAFSFVSSEALDNAGLIPALIVLLIIVLIGIVFDIIGVSVTAADEKPFHSMAAQKIPEAADALRLVRNAEKVGSVCNDVIGDICGVISGSASASIAVIAFSSHESIRSLLLKLLMSALVAGVTVGGKAIGKTFAIGNSTAIVHATAKLICFFRLLPRRLFGQKR